MQQHADAKEGYPDCIIFFRLGDFYEMFGDDAVVVSRELDLTLTSRNKGKTDEIPMAGLPHHAAHAYIARLMRKGFKVAVCEQMADPKTVKGIVPRQVVRVITPGTWTDSPDLPQSENQWLCAVHEHENCFGLSLFDLTTSELLAAEVSDLASVLSEISRARPLEILLPANIQFREAVESVANQAQIRNDDEITPEESDKVLFGIESEVIAGPALYAAARCLRFARACYQEKTFPIWRIASWNPSGILGLDQSAQRHLELVESTVAEKKATLFAVINRSCSAPGSRLLRRRLLAPLTDVRLISQRQDQVEAFVGSHNVRTKVRAKLSELPDLERLAVRASLFELNPKDLGKVRDGLHAAESCFLSLSGLESKAAKLALKADSPPDFSPELRNRLDRSLVAAPPANSKEGAIFQNEFDAELDGYMRLRTSGSERIAAFEDELRHSTKISNLKVKSTRVFGWYIEVPKSQLGRVPEHFKRKQTVASGERYTLNDLDEIAEEIESAEENFRSRELALLRELYEQAAQAAQAFHRLASVLAHLDVAACLAEVAVDFDYVRPVVDESDELEIIEGRHPVVERLAAAGRFVPNDVSLRAREQHLWLISGPNMAGKSTFLRQVALIAILAQMGSFVPAQKARIGVFDRVLSRVGASDNLAGGESTFMVEMRETAEILHSATSRSLVILDEVGRGTSTYDGLSIAWAVAEHLDQLVRCRALFATHYHELTELGETSPSAANYCVSAKQHKGEIVFLHRVQKGAASRSYGVEVARLAGIPEGVLCRARGLLERYEKGQADSVAQVTAADTAGAQLDFFGNAGATASEKEAIATLRALDLERMTSLESLQLLTKLQKLLQS